MTTSKPGNKLLDPPRSKGKAHQKGNRKSNRKHKEQGRRICSRSEEGQEITRRCGEKDKEL